MVALQKYFFKSILEVDNLESKDQDFVLNRNPLDNSPEMRLCSKQHEVRMELKVVL